MSKQVHSFNLNDTVWVKLTDHGRQIMKENHEQLNQTVVERGGKELAPLMLSCDLDGYSPFQFWSLMLEFGAHMGVAMPLCFDLDIQIRSR